MSVPYIGCKIGLISKSQIRYEGTLFTIDAKESTIALSNVRSFGTEGRRDGGQEIPPSNEIYEFIIFRASDIKDLYVSDNSPAPAAPIDPAIVHTSSPGQKLGFPGQPPHFNPYTNYPPYGYPPYPYGYPPAQFPPNQPAIPQSQQTPPQHNIPNTPVSTLPQQTPLSLIVHTPSPKVQNPSSIESQKPLTYAAVAEGEKLQFKKQDDSVHFNDNNRSQNQWGRNKYDNHQKGGYYQHHDNYRGGRGGGRGGGFQSQKLEDIDFESLPKLDREKIHEEILNTKESDSQTPLHRDELEIIEQIDEEGKLPQVYDKTKSFFDNLTVDSTAEKKDRKEVFNQRKS